MKQQQLYGCTFSDQNQFREPRISCLDYFNSQSSKAAVEILGEKWKSLGKKQIPKESQQTKKNKGKHWQKFSPQKFQQNEYPADNPRPHSPKCFQVASSHASSNQKSGILTYLKNINDQNLKRSHNSFKNVFRRYQSSQKHSSFGKNIVISQAINADDESPLKICINTNRSKDSFLANDSNVKPNNKSSESNFYNKNYFNSKAYPKEDKQFDNQNLIEFSSMKEIKQQISRIFNQPSQRVVKQQCTTRRELLNLISLCSKRDNVLEQNFSEKIKYKLIGVLDSLQSQRKIFVKFKFQLSKEVQNLFSFCFKSIKSLKNEYQSEIQRLKISISLLQKGQLSKLSAFKEEQPINIFRMKIPQLKLQNSSIKGLQYGNSDMFTINDQTSNQICQLNSNLYELIKSKHIAENNVKPLHINNQHIDNYLNRQKSQTVDKKLQINCRQPKTSLMLAQNFGFNTEKIDIQRDQKLQTDQRVKSLPKQIPMKENRFQRAKSFQKFFETLQTMKKNVYSRNQLSSKQDIGQKKICSPKKGILKIISKYDSSKLLKTQHIL